MPATFVDDKLHLTTMPRQKGNVTVIHNESFSQHECFHFHHTWDIFNFSSKESSFSSSSFVSGDVSWNVLVDPCRKVNSQTLVSVHIRRVYSSATHTHILEVSILRRDGSKSHSKRASWYEVANRESYVDLIERDVLLNNESDLLVEDKLTIVCEFSFKKEKNGVSIEECQVEDDLERLLDNQDGSDITLSTGMQELRAHKAILMARSSVFAAMLQNDMNERSTNSILIPDISHQVLSEMLRFIYTGRKPQDEEIYDELLIAADKYDLQRLKAICEKSLSSTISVNTAAERLSLADRHNAEKLKMRAIDYITEHSTHVLLTDGWKDVKDSQPHLVGEIINNICRRAEFLKRK